MDQAPASVSVDDISPAITEIESPLNNGDNVPSPIMTTKEGRMRLREKKKAGLFGRRVAPTTEEGTADASA